MIAPATALGDLPFQPRSLGGEMKCPVCQQNTSDNWQPLVVLEHPGYRAGLRVEPPKPKKEGALAVSSEVSFDWMYCANDECRQLVVRVHENLLLPPHAVEDPEMLTRTWLARPRTASRSIDPAVPEPFRTDYLEAAAILDASPRMSAVLSRRILADLLREFAKQDQYGLTEQIDAFRADTTHPTHVRKPLHYLREIGDFSAHTQTTDQAEIIDVDREEAEWTLNVIDRLFDYFIVSPAADEALYQSMDEKLGGVGRKPIKPLTDEEDSK